LRLVAASAFIAAATFSFPHPKKKDHEGARPRKRPRLSSTADRNNKRARDEGEIRATQKRQETRRGEEKAARFVRGSRRGGPDGCDGDRG
jgi:hypothetical protein